VIFVAFNFDFILALIIEIKVQLAKKERTYEPNSKFDKTFKIFSKSYHNMKFTVDLLVKQ
jgi:hypothetical protein